MAHQTELHKSLTVLTRPCFILRRSTVLRARILASLGILVHVNLGFISPYIWPSRSGPFLFTLRRANDLAVFLLPGVVMLLVGRWSLRSHYTYFPFPVSLAVTPACQTDVTPRAVGFFLSICTWVAPIDLVGSGQVPMYVWLAGIFFLSHLNECLSVAPSIYGLPCVVILFVGRQAEGGERARLLASLLAYSGWVQITESYSDARPE